jgi:gluconate 5-dehydrogenase
MKDKNQNQLPGDFNLDGKVTLITGGGTGLGKAMALAMAQSGANVVISGRRIKPLQEVVGKIKTMGGQAILIQTDVTKSTQVNSMVEKTIDIFGTIDVLINNAGIVRNDKPTPIWDITDTAWNLGINTNLTGAFYCARAASSHMVKQGQGKIINISSVFGLRGGKDSFIYCCAKGGVLQLTRSLAVSLARFGVTSNCIVPGYIPTEGTEAMQESLPKEDFVPVGRFGTFDEIGDVAVFLGSNASDYMNGSVFTLDGGALAGGFAPTNHSPIVPLQN